MYRIQIEDATYPELLKEISKPPKTLYCMGDIRLLQAERKVAVVGTRTATDYGKLCCQKLVSTLCSANVVTVSGLALGIDAICQEATLNLKGKRLPLWVPVWMKFTQNKIQIFGSELQRRAC